MSDELRDEVEAINSIYGDETLVVDPDASTRGGDAADGRYILQLPGDEASSLKLAFPAQYPEAGGPPSVLGTHHSSGGIKGAGARDVRLFQASLAQVYQEGAVCLFDAVEEFSRALEEEQLANEQEEAAADERNGGGDGSYQEGERTSARAAAAQDGDEYSGVDLASLPPPPWVLSEPVVDAKSTFVAHVAVVTSPAQARLYVAQLLASDKRIRTATHNITAWRIRGGGAASGVSYQDCDDDGEDAAGGRLLHLMQLMELWDVMVVVTRWYGGVKLGPRRFAVINSVARDGFVRAGMVMEGSGGKGKKK